MRATVNPRNNLAHCFCCAKNINNIDLLMTLDYDFLSAVALLVLFLALVAFLGDFCRIGIRGGDVGYTGNLRTSANGLRDTPLVLDDFYRTPPLPRAFLRS